jgi:hypothetical protein
MALIGYCRVSASDIDLFRDRQGIIDLDFEVSDRAFDLRMAEKQLDSPQIAGPPVYQRGLGASEGMGAVVGWFEADAADPGGNQSSILPRAEMAMFAATASEKEIATCSAAGAEIGHHGLPGVICYLECHGAARLALANRRPIRDRAVRGDVVNLERHQIAPSQLAVDGEIEECQIPDPLRYLEMSANRPDVLRLEWRFGANELAPVPRIVAGIVFSLRFKGLHLIPPFVSLKGGTFCCRQHSADDSG